MDLAGENNIHLEKLQNETAHLGALRRMAVLQSYYEWSLSRLLPWVGKRVLDAGCGIGNGTKLLARHSEYVAAVDLSAVNLEELRRSVGNTRSIEVIQMDLEGDLSRLQQSCLDTIVCLDVLEHVYDDTQLLANFLRVVQPEGTLLVKVPAMPSLFGSVDEASSHYRRYSRTVLMSVAQNAGWNVLWCKYMNIFGVVPYFIKSRVLRRRANFSRTFAPWQLGILERLTPMMARFDRIVGPPIGQSLLMVAKKEANEW